MTAFSCVACAARQSTHTDLPSLRAPTDYRAASKAAKQQLALGGEISQPQRTGVPQPGLGQDRHMHVCVWVS